MIEFNCPKCAETMSVPDSLAGQSEICPACREGVVVPPPRMPIWKRRWFIPTVVGGLFVLVGLLLAVWAIATSDRGDRTTTTDDLDGKTPILVGQRAEESVRPRYAIVRALERGGDHHSYSILSPPMTRSDLDQMVKDIIAASPYKPYRYFFRVYFSEDNWKLDTDPKGLEPYHSAVLIFVRPSDNTFDVSGAIPKSRSIKACYEAHLAEEKYEEWHRASVQYDVAKRHLKISDYHVGYRTIPGIVYALTKEFFLPGRPWSHIPGLDVVEITVVDEDGRELAQVKMTRAARDAAIRFYRRMDLSRRVAAVDDKAYYAALRRHKAGLLTDNELEIIDAAQALKRYRLYESVWVAAALHMEVKFRSGLSREMPKGPFL